MFYQIFQDRFAKSDSVEKPYNLEPWDSDPTPFGYKGGDLAGVRERLDYLQDLGVTALYFNPIFQSASNHRFRQRVKAINPEAYIVGEIWGDSRQWLQGDQFDGVMNYLFAEAAIAFSAGHRVRRETVEDRSYAPWPGIDGRAYAAKIDHLLLRLYPWPIQLSLLDSHDTSRFVTIASDDRASVRLGTLLLFTFPGAPSIYYGDEIGLAGALPPDCWARRTFPWDHPERWNLDVLALHKILIALCRSQPALQTGDYIPLYTDADVYAFARTLKGSTLITAVNVAEHPRRFEIPLTDLRSTQPATPTILFATDGSPTAKLAPGAQLLTLPPRSGAVFDASPATDDRARD